MKKDKGKNIMDTIIIETSLGTVAGRKTDGCLEFLGIPYAKAERFRYAESIEHFEGVLDATEYGNACPQYRQYFPQLDNPERLFYHREFRQGIPFHYDEDCLNLNIFTPENPDHCPVAVFIHGGGFNSGSNTEEPFRGYELAKRGIITVFINYRVGIFGYLTHADIQKEYGRDGNFGLDDQLTALKWVKRHIADFGGDSENITVCGQSAGAMSIQYLCLNHDNAGLFRRVLMMSGAGLFPKFASPREAEVTREYWLQLMDSIGCTSLEELRSLDAAALLSAAQDLKGRRKDTLYNTMPVIDGVLIKGHIDELIRRPLPVGYMIGYTNTDLYAPLMAYIGNRFGRDNNAYIYYFDIDAPGDENKAFHSSDLRYLFGRLEQSWRPYGERDFEVSKQMMDYLAAYCRSGNPNGPGRPYWQCCHDGNVNILRFGADRTAEEKPSLAKLARNMIQKGNPKA